MSFWKQWSSRVGRIPMWIVSLGIGILCVVIGLGKEQFAEIYRKAVMICLECIGIG